MSKVTRLKTVYFYLNRFNLDSILNDLFDNTLSSRYNPLNRKTVKSIIEGIYSNYHYSSNNNTKVELTLVRDNTGIKYPFYLKVAVIYTDLFGDKNNSYLEYIKRVRHYGNLPRVNSILATHSECYNYKDAFRVNGFFSRFYDTVPDTRYRELLFTNDINQFNSYIEETIHSNGVKYHNFMVNLQLLKHISSKRYFLKYTITSVNTNNLFGNNLPIYVDSLLI